MVFENIEQLKQDYTDKYVVVDDARPELARFRGQTGVVKTVNMSGKALVQFDAHENIGWYDIAVQFLNVIDKPLPKEAPPEKKKPPAKKPAAAAAAAKPAAGKMNVADVLAAARGGSGTTGADPSVKAKPSPTKSAEEKPAEKKSAAADSGKMSVADILAAARGEKAAGSPAPPAAQAPVDDEQTTNSVAAPASAPPESASAAEDSETLPTDTAGIVAWCRARDGK